LHTSCLSTINMSKTEHRADGGGHWFPQLVAMERGGWGGGSPVTAPAEVSAL
jgi:hypothetical protein